MNSQVIMSKLEELHSIDINFEIFGAEHHKYKLNPPLTIKEIIQFERKYKIELPSDYRIFLIEIGNGGAGPYYGLYPLGENEVGPWVEGDMVGDLSKPFPYTKDWNALPNYPNEDDKYKKIKNKNKNKNKKYLG